MKEKIYYLHDLEVKGMDVDNYDESITYYTPDKKGEICFTHNRNGDGEMTQEITKESPDHDYVICKDYDKNIHYIFECEKEPVD